MKKTKEINEKTVSRAKAGIVIFGIIRGLLYSVCGLLTLVYSYALLSSTIPSGSGYWGGWVPEGFARLIGQENLFSPDSWRLWELYDKLGEFYATMTRIFGPHWLSVIYFSAIIILFTVCVILYFIARSLRTTVAASELD